MAITVAMRTQVSQLYVSLFGRAPDGEGLGFWVGQLDAGKTMAQVAQDMYSVPAARAYYPAYATNEEIVATFYQNVLGRAVGNDTEGQAFWVAEMNKPGATKGTVIAKLLDTVANYTGTNADGVASKALFNNKVAVAQYYGEQNGSIAGATTVLSSVTSDVASVATAKTAAAASAAAATGSTFALTTGVDTFVGTSGGDTFNASVTATSATLGGLDVVDGGAGVDTFNIADTNTAAAADFALPTGLTISNVETLSIVTNGAIGTAAATDFDTSSIAGLTTAKFVAAGAGTANGSQVKVADTTAVSLTVSGANTATVTGGSSATVNAGTGAVVVTGAKLTSVTVTGGDVSAANSIDNGAAVKTLTAVTLDKVDTAASIRGAGIETVTLKGAVATGGRTTTITNATVDHSLTINVDGTGWTNAATPVEAQSVLADAAAKTITVNATGSKSSLALTGSTAATTVNVTGSADLTLAPLASATKLNASAATGKLTLGSLNAATVTVTTGTNNDTATLLATTKATVDTGAGNDTLTLGAALAAGSTVNLGAGNDVLSGTTAVAASSGTNVTVIDGGEGTDSVSSGVITAGNAAQFKNFESISIQASVDASLMTASTITGLSIDGSTGTSVITGVTQSQGLTVSANNGGTSATLTFTGVTGTTDAYAIGFNATTTGTAASPTSIDAKIVSVEGIEAVTVNSGAAAGVVTNAIALKDANAKTLTITGSQALNVTFDTAFGTAAATTGVSSIDGSAASGKLGINLANVGVIDAGITVIGGSADDTITTIAAKTQTLTGGAGKDTFVVAASAGIAPVVTITDLTVGDKIDLAGTIAAAGTLGTKADVSAATSLATALDIANGATGTVATTALSWFQYGGNTYVYADVPAAGPVSGTVDATDNIVKITGLIDLSTSTFTTAAILTVVAV